MNIVARFRLADLPLRRYRHDFPLPRIWHLRNNSRHMTLSTLPAAALDASLLTRDHRLGDAAGAHI